MDWLALLEKLNQHSLGEFTGRTNILLEDSKQLLGGIYFHRGQCWHAYFDDQVGIRALQKVIYSYFHGARLCFVDEPESLTKVAWSIHATAEELQSELLQYFQVVEFSSSRKPPLNIQLSLTSKVFDQSCHLSCDEYQILLLLVRGDDIKKMWGDWSKEWFWIAPRLVQLRQKNAITVSNHTKGDL